MDYLHLYTDLRLSQTRIVSEVHGEAVRCVHVEEGSFFGAGDECLPVGWDRGEKSSASSAADFFQQGQSFGFVKGNECFHTSVRMDERGAKRRMLAWSEHFQHFVPCFDEQGQYVCPHERQVAGKHEERLLQYA